MPVDLFQCILFQKNIFQVYCKYQSCLLFVFPSKIKWGEKKAAKWQNQFLFRLIFMLPACYYWKNAEIE